jgi:type III secretion system YscJ/HrcJ family lipoprotein
MLNERALRRTLRNALTLVVMALCLAACKNDLFTKQTESDANSMVSALLENGIDAQKQTPDGGKTWSIAVDQDDVVRSLAVLRAQGLPQEKFVNLGDMFKKEGLISTPTEERVRFIHGVSQELSATLSQIDGVIAARVHIVLPNNDPMAPAVKPSSASVFVKYRPQANLTALHAGDQEHGCAQRGRPGLRQRLDHAGAGRHDRAAAAGFVGRPRDRGLDRRLGRAAARRHRLGGAAPARLAARRGGAAPAEDRRRSSRGSMTHDAASLAGLALAFERRLEALPAAIDPSWQAIAELRSMAAGLPEGPARRRVTLRLFRRCAARSQRSPTWPGRPVS